MKQIQIFFQHLRYAKKEKFDQIDQKVTEIYFTKKIFQFLQDQVLVTRLQKEF